MSFPDTLISIGESAFANAMLSEIVLPDKRLVHIGKECFAFCSWLTALLSAVTIPRCVKQIEDRAFAECIILGSATILGCRATVSPTAFQGIPNFVMYCSTDVFTEPVEQ